MAKTLKEKQNQLEEAHFAEVENQLMEAHDAGFIRDAYEIRGALRTVSAIAQGLMSQHIRGLMMVEDRKLWKPLGYPSFADYLSNAEEVGMSKSKYYESRDVLLNSGDEVLDAITGKASPRKIKALLAGGIPVSVEGGQLKVGDESIGVNDSKGISRLVEAWHQTLTERDDLEKKQSAKIQKLERQIEIGRDENQQLRRRLDSVDETSRFDRALMGLVSEFLNLTEAIGELDESERSRGKDDLQIVAGLYFRLADTYGVKAQLSRSKASEAAIDKAIAELDTEDLD